MRSENLRNRNRVRADGGGNVFYVKVVQKVGNWGWAVKRVCRKSAPGMTGLLVSFMWLMLGWLQVTRVVGTMMGSMVGFCQAQ